MTTTAHDAPDMAGLAEEVLANASRELALDAPDFPQEVRDAHDDSAAAIGDVLAAGRQARADLGELRSKRDLIPPQGRDRLRREAINAAETNAREAERRAEQALEQLRESLNEAALPVLDPARERLAREELTLALGNVAGDKAHARVTHIARTGSYESAAVLLRSSFGRTLLESRGLTGRALEETLTQARTVAASVAHERGRTPRELLAGASVARLGKLAAARGAASLAVRHAVRER